MSRRSRNTGALTSLEARDGGGNLYTAGQEVWQPGEGHGKKESEDGSASVDASFASQCHG